MKVIVKKVGVILVSFFIAFSFSVSVSADFNGSYTDYITEYSRKEELFLDDGVSVEYYIEDNGRIDDVIRVTYISGQAINQVIIKDGFVIERNLQTGKENYYPIEPSTAEIDNEDNNMVNILSTSSDGFTYMNKVVYATAFIGEKYIGVWQKHIKTSKNANYKEPRPNGIALGVIVSLISTAFGLMVPQIMVFKLIVAGGGTVVGGLIQGLSKGLEAVGTIINYHMKITEGSGPRTRIYKDAMYFSGNVNGKIVTQYTGMYPQFSAFKDMTVATAIYNDFWDGLFHVRSWY